MTAAPFAAGVAAGAALTVLAATAALAAWQWHSDAHREQVLANRARSRVFVDGREVS